MVCILKALKLFLLRCFCGSRCTRVNWVGSTHQAVKVWELWASLDGVGGCCPAAWGTLETSRVASPPAQLHFPGELAAHGLLKRNNVLRPNPLTPIVPKTRLPDWRTFSQCILGLVVQPVQGASFFVIRGADSALRARPREAGPKGARLRRARRARPHLPRGGAVGSASTPPSCTALRRTRPAPSSWSHS